MDKTITETMKAVKSALEAAGLRVDRIVLFGSHAAGKAAEASDIDIAVISENFKEMNLLERLETIGLALAQAKIMEPVEALGYTEKEFESKGKGTFAGDEIKSKGIEVL